MTTLATFGSSAGLAEGSDAEAVVVALFAVLLAAAGVEDEKYPPNQEEEAVVVVAVVIVEALVAAVSLVSAVVVDCEAVESLLVVGLIAGAGGTVLLLVAPVKTLEADVTA